jgi:hypothetical protein
MVGPGGAKFGAGSGGSARFDHTARGGGLWASGFDQSDPGIGGQVKAWYGSQAANVRGEVDKYFTGANASKRGTEAGLVEAVDWRQRDVARKIQKENGFLDSTFGKILVTAAQIGVTLATGNPYAATAIGAVTGGVKGGIKGAALGGLAGYGVGTGTQFVAGGGISRTFNTLLGKGASSSVSGVTQNAAGYLEHTPGIASTGSKASSFLSRAGGVIKGAGSSIDTAVGAVNAGVGLKNLLAPAAAGGAVYLGASAASTPNLDVNPPPAPVETRTPYEAQVEKERKRRRMTQTDVTWGSVLNDPSLKKPTLLGGATKLAA